MLVLVPCHRDQLILGVCCFDLYDDGPRDLGLLDCPVRGLGLVFWLIGIRFSLVAPRLLVVPLSVVWAVVILY